MSKNKGKKPVAYDSDEEEALNNYLEELSLQHIPPHPSQQASSQASTSTSTSHVPVPMSSDELLQQYQSKKLQEQQLENQRLTKELQELRQLLQQERAKAKQKMKAKGRTAEDDGIDSDDSSSYTAPPVGNRQNPTTGHPGHDKKIGDIARAFYLNNEMFIDADWFMQPRPNTNSLEGRYPREKEKQPQALRIAIIAELYEKTDELYHPQLQTSPAFQAVFQHAVSSLRRTLISDLRKKAAAAVIFDAPDDIASLYAPDKYKQRGETSFFLSKLVWDEALDDRRMVRFSLLLFPPILFKDGVRNFREGVFRNPELPMCARVDLFSENSLIPEWLIDGEIKPDPKSRGIKYFKKAGPGLVSRTCIQVIFIHNNDKYLEPVGANSKFPYQKAFNFYKKFLIEGMNLGKKDGKDLSEPYKDIFRFWNSYILPRSMQETDEEEIGEVRQDDDEYEEAAAAMLCDNENSNVVGQFDEDEDDFGQQSGRWPVDISSIEISHDLVKLRSQLQHFPSISHSADLIDGLQELSKVVAPSSVPREASPQFLKFLERIENANPNDPAIPKDDGNENWGHHQFTAGSLTLRSTITSWDAVGSAEHAARLLAAAIRTCHAARIICGDRNIPVKDDEYLSDAYLDQTVQVLWTVVEPKVSLLRSSGRNSDLEIVVEDLTAAGPVPTSGDVKKALNLWTVRHLKAWIKEREIPSKVTKATKKAELVNIILESQHIPSSNELTEWRQRSF
ncbi:hypothetical protein CC2G_011345 [Coprinopsis cinerea AmutBmut pab1-1]|nr:hypothetical protein CC2G_011345 [Coprinopsis cinerea AmutBmut pab1-1]